MIPAAAAGAIGAAAAEAATDIALDKLPDFLDLGKGALSKGDYNSAREANKGAEIDLKRQQYEEHKLGKDRMTDAARRGLTTDVKSTIGLRPKDYLIRNGLRTLTNSVETGGIISKLRGNRLAAAILGGLRDATPEQTRHFGYSPIDNAMQMWAQKRMLKGDTINAVTAGLADTLRAGTNEYIANEDKIKDLIYADAFGQQTGTLDYLGRQVSNNGPKAQEELNDRQRKRRDEFFKETE